MYPLFVEQGGSNVRSYLGGVFFNFCYNKYCYSHSSWNPILTRQIVKRLLFLDVDGVLNNIKSNSDLYPESLLLLSNVVAKTQCKIVLSSTWRLYPETLAELESAFLEYKIPKWIGSTPYINSQPRSEEIVSWLLENSKDPTNVVVLDDDKDAEIQDDLEFIKTSFVQTNFSNGFTFDHAQKVISLFELYPLG